MSEILLPDVLKSTLCDLLEKQRLSSWNIHGGLKSTTVTLRFSTEQGSHVFPSAGFRRKSPCEIRRDEQRARSRRLEKNTLPVTEQVEPKTSTPTEHATRPTVLSVDQLCEGNEAFENSEDNVSTFDDNYQQSESVNNTSEKATFEECMMELLHSMEEDLTSKLDSCRRDMQSSFGSNHQKEDHVHLFKDNDFLA